MGRAVWAVSLTSCNFYPFRASGRALICSPVYEQYAKVYFIQSNIYFFSIEIDKV